ncbi:uncharacterized protein FA14DRAFT_166349 [Meira miltonrushii]|uniref:Elongation of fatty acids protein n=1 Tax=Meira miltonrushii TaxID=1280837 RepID=A0A316VGL0_9BASI|nr:uncharacterized protein FA14DRAFT_166349 [Meira miltonrushii]PWN36769.1 hypothetical protein FA14DRAFT_166349 [Meira miltonrushii]
MTYPLDKVGTKVSNLLHYQPYPAYPFKDTVLAHVFPKTFFDWSLQLAVPVTFALLYYTIAHSANHFQSGFDHTKGDSFKAKVLRAVVILHNAGLCLYSFFTFFMSAPVALDLFAQGWRAAGHEGLKLALCSIPATNSLIGRWSYIFYLSKYYEVMDSIILYLKGKKIGNLQSYHHAGALFSMWIAYRLQAQAVWVFVVFNSGVHTFMYAYYFCAALKLPFPKTLKRNLTTLQILQIASGTLLVNLYYFLKLDPVYVYGQLLGSATAQSGFSKALFGSSKSALTASAAGQSLMQLSTYAQARATFPASQRDSCIETTGSAVAILGNTLYMGPLLVLFANFFISSYFKQQQQSKANGFAKGKQQNGNGKAVNGKH